MRRFAALAAVLAWLATGAVVGAARGAVDSRNADADIPNGRLVQSPDEERKAALERMRSNPSEIIQAGAIDAARYVLGPGDVLEIDLWGPLTRSDLVRVSPEGSILIPGGGPLRVEGRTLAEARQQVLQVLARALRGVHAEVRIVQLRTFKIYVTGFVKTPGPFTASSVTRASEALYQAGLAEEASRRNIRIRHRDGTEARLDFDLLQTDGRQAADPVLVDGDVIVVPRAVEFVRVAGAVARALRFEHVAGDSLNTLIALAGGLLPSAVTDRALLVRFPTASTRESVWVNLDAVLRGEKDLVLADGDHLFVGARSDFHVLPSVGVYGEVERPGEYPIVLGRDRFSDLIGWAGGFRPFANRAAIHFLRESAAQSENDPEFQRLVRLSRSEMTESEYTKFQTKLAERTNSFRIDWARVQKDRIDVDPLLQQGDVVRVDQLVSTVRVEGQVRRPGFVDYAAGRSLGEYVELSGGFTDRAARRSISVSRSLTGQVIPARSLGGVQPGDFIWVPERRDVDAWAVFRDVVNVASQIALLVFTLSR